jgi:hypothetical protein
MLEYLSREKDQSVLCNFAHAAACMKRLGLDVSVPVKVAEASLWKTVVDVLGRGYIDNYISIMGDMHCVGIDVSTSVKQHKKDMLAKIKTEASDGFVTSLAHHAVAMESLGLGVRDVTAPCNAQFLTKAKEFVENGAWDSYETLYVWSLVKLGIIRPPTDGTALTGMPPLKRFGR